MSSAVARVIRWDEKEAIAECPYCWKQHRHTISFLTNASKDQRKTLKLGHVHTGLNNASIQQAVAPCLENYEHLSSPITYRLLFPFEDDNRVRDYNWEIRPFPLRQTDRSHSKCFQTVGTLSKPDYMEENEIHKISQKLTSIGLEEGSKREHTSCFISVPEMEIKCAQGSTDLSLAVVRGEKERVLELLHENVDVNARDMLGRTPLMEAALWGHVEVTKILLESKANPTKTDKERRQAVDLAEECDRNDEEREERHLNYLEKPSEKKRARRIIRGLLGAVPSSGNSLMKSLKSYYAARIYKCRNLWTASLVLPIVGVEIKHEHQTIAFLDRDKPFDMIHAASGWSGSGHNEFCLRSGHYEKLDANYWTAQALNLARKIGLPFPSHPRDGKMIGTYNACHAEAQLVAFFVEHHLPIVEVTNYQSENLFSQQCRKQNPIQKAKIIVSQDPCGSCMDFITCVMRKQNCDFEVVVAREIFS